MYKQIDSNKTKTFLYLTIFLLAVIGFGWLLSYIYDNPAILVIAVVVSVIQAWVSYYHADAIALAVSHAQPVQAATNHQLINLVENLSITAGLPTPKVYIIPDTAINAFATGRDPKHASLAVTEGALEKLDKNELQGVLAHEMSHIGDYDIRLSTMVVVLVGVIALASDWFLRSLWWGGGGRRRDSNDSSAGIFLLVGIILAILAPIIATLIQLAISRKRELLADANGALLTRYPQGLADALEKIKGDNEQLAVANKATAHLYFANPFGNVGGWLNGLFDTHPPIDERIKILRAMI